MRIVEALSRLANRHAGARFSGLTATQQADGVDALNRGLMELYELLPDWFKTKEISMSVEAPASVSLQATNGSATLVNTPFSSTHVGRTVLADADPAEHRVAGTGQLRDVWLGSTGTHNAVVYHDYVYGSDYPFDRLLSEPMLLDGSNTIALQLINPEAIDLRTARKVGRPEYYWIEAGGLSQGGTVPMAIRLLPRPAVAYRIRARASYWPKRIRFEDVPDNGILPVPDSLAEAFIQISGAHVIGLAGWDAMRSDEAMAHAQMGRARAARMTPSAGVPSNRVFTPRGW